MANTILPVARSASTALPFRVVTLRPLVLALVVLIVVGFSPLPAGADNFSFTGNFATDDEVQLFGFVVGAPSQVTLRTWSYAGGTNADGVPIPRGGFDPILALFNASGMRINQNDDGGCALVAADALSGVCFDTFLSSPLSAGAYTVSVMQYDNLSAGATLSAGFTRQGEGNFTAAPSWPCQAVGTPFQDVTGSLPGCQRDSHWAFDILNVQTATPADSGVIPEPATLLLLGTGLVGAALRRR